MDDYLQKCAQAGNSNNRPSHAVRTHPAGPLDQTTQQASKSFVHRRPRGPDAAMPVQPTATSRAGPPERSAHEASRVSPFQLPPVTLLNCTYKRQRRSTPRVDGQQADESKLACCAFQVGIVMLKCKLVRTATLPPPHPPNCANDAQGFAGKRTPSAHDGI